MQRDGTMAAHPMAIVFPAPLSVAACTSAAFAAAPAVQQLQAAEWSTMQPVATLGHFMPSPMPLVMPVSAVAPGAPIEEVAAAAAHASTGVFENEPFSQQRRPILPALTSLARAIASRGARVDSPLAKYAQDFAELFPSQGRGDELVCERLGFKTLVEEAVADIMQTDPKSPPGRSLTRRAAGCASGTSA